MTGSGWAIERPDRRRAWIRREIHDLSQQCSQTSFPPFIVTRALWFFR